MSFKTPYSNMHELNLDWIMKAIKNLFGGTGGQYLRKKSNTQFDYEWHTITPSDIGAMPADATLSSQDVSFDRSENYTEPSIGAELKDIEDVVQIPTNLDGSVITFNATEELPFIKCIVDMEPVQDFNGYDHPWPSGGGKNKFYIPSNTDQIAGVTYAYDDTTNAITKSGTCTGGAGINIGEFSVPNGTYTFSAKFSETGQPSTVYLRDKDTNTNIGSINAGISQTTLTLDGTYYLRIGTNGNGTTGGTISEFQIETGNQKTSYAPYSNICPITGWTEENVWIKSDYDPSSTPTKTIDFGGTYYGGSLDVIHGALKITYDNIASYAGETLTTEWISSMDVYSPGGTPTTGAQVVYKLDPPFVVQVQPTDALITIQGVNNVWCDTGNSEITIFKSLKEILNSL